MPAADVLKNLRNNDYGSDKPSDSSESKGMDSGQKVETPRIISLTDDEKKAFANSKPGEDLACEVHGTLEEDGHFHVMSVSPLGGGDSYPGDEKEMAGVVAQRVQPNIVPSPS